MTHVTNSPYHATGRRCSRPQAVTGIRAYAGLFLGVVLAPPAGAWVVDQQATVNINGSGYYASFDDGKSFQIIDSPFSIPYGAGWGNVGLWAGAGGHADIDAIFRVDSHNSFSLASQAQARTVIIPSVKNPVVGDSFFLYNSIDPLGIQKLNVASDGFMADVRVGVDVGGWASAKACLIGCIAANVSLNLVRNVTLASVNPWGFELFNKLVDTSPPPYEASLFGGLATGTGNIPTFSKTFTNVPAGVSPSLIGKQEPLFTVKTDIAELLVKTVGFPIPLEGDLLGFGYELLSLDAYAGVDLRHSVTFTPDSLETMYQFSSPVEINVNGTWVPYNKPFLSLGDEVGVELRAPKAASLSITRSHVLTYDVDYDFDLVLKAGLELDALELHGFGLHLGPLINPDPWEIDIASVDLTSGTTIGTLMTKGGTSTLSFDMLYADNGVVINLCATAPGCTATGYITEHANLDGGIVEETIRRVTNYGDTCNDYSPLACNFDSSFLPIVTQRRVTDIVDPLPWYDDTVLLAALSTAGITPPSADWFTPYDPFDQNGVFAPDFSALNALLNAVPLIEAPASDDAMMLTALRALGINPAHPFPPHSAPEGAPYEALYALTKDLTEDRNGEITFRVPEPPALGLLAVAGLAAAFARQLRRVVRS